jgi:AcrR family transcriptional regulator
MSRRPKKPVDLREACVAEAYRVIAELGVEKLSLREVARRLGVSHQAPYRHFPSRDHILAEVIARAYASFSDHLRLRRGSSDAQADLESMGRSYIAYALDHPLQYRLMFGTPLPDPDSHPRMMENAQDAFAILRDRLATMSLRRDRKQPADPADDALFIWSTLHGLASILHSDAIHKTDLTRRNRTEVIDHIFWRLGLSLRP